MFNMGMLLEDLKNPAIHFLALDLLISNSLDQNPI